MPDDNARSENWFDAGPVSEFSQRDVSEVVAGKTKIALIHKAGVFTAISGVCNHVAGPLGHGTLDGDYVVCPWHHWKFHRATGEGEPGYEADKVPAYKTKIENDQVWIDLSSADKRSHAQHDPHPLARPVKREAGPIRVVGISTTAMDVAYPRVSTSDLLLEAALDHARTKGCEAKMIKLTELKFRNCEGYYSKSAYACTWPCSITQMDPEDQLDRVYEAFVHWADVILIATPIRWGNASSLYYKMVERMNCIQNQETIANKHLMKNKAAGFIITGGQDNVQAVAGQMLTFFSEVGCQFPQFPFIAHSRGWSAEDMENNVKAVINSDDLKQGARGLVERCIDMATLLVAGEIPEPALIRGGRKAHPLKILDPR